VWNCLCGPAMVNSFEDERCILNRSIYKKLFRHSRLIRVQFNELPGREKRCGKQDGVLSLFVHGKPRD